MIKKLFKSVEEHVYGFVGSWAFYIGSCVADGFNERMNDIQEEESGMPQEGEQDPFEVKVPASDSGGSHGAN